MKKFLLSAFAAAALCASLVFAQSVRSTDQRGPSPEDTPVRKAEPAVEADLKLDTPKQGELVQDFSGPYRGLPAYETAMNAWLEKNAGQITITRIRLTSTRKPWRGELMPHIHFLVFYRPNKS